jgi:hypothetical protein
MPLDPKVRKWSKADVLWTVSQSWDSSRGYVCMQVMRLHACDPLSSLLPSSAHNERRSDTSCSMVGFGELLERPTNALLVLPVEKLLQSRIFTTIIQYS